MDMKINNKSNSVEESDFNVVPDASELNGKSKDSFVKQEQKEEDRKLFANKKFNIAIIIICAVLVVAVIGIIVFLNMV